MASPPVALRPLEHFHILPALGNIQGGTCVFPYVLRILLQSAPRVVVDVVTFYGRGFFIKHRLASKASDEVDLFAHADYTGVVTWSRHVGDRVPSTGEDIVPKHDFFYNTSIFYIPFQVSGAIQRGNQEILDRIE